MERLVDKLGLVKNVEGWDIKFHYYVTAGLYELESYKYVNGEWVFQGRVETDDIDVACQFVDHTLQVIADG